MVKPSSSSSSSPSPCSTSPHVWDSSTSTTTTTTSSSSSSSSSSNSSSCKYKGVRKRKWGKWVSEIRLPNSRERIWLGSYDSAEKAARAFDAALYCLRGRDAKFNFPENPPEIAGGRSLSPHQIQAVAASFANDNNVQYRNLINNNNNNNNNSCNDNMNVGTELAVQYTTTTTTPTPTTTTTTTTTTTSSSLSISPTIQQQVESGIMDWSSFLSMLDANQGMSSEYGFYPAPPAPGLAHHQPMLPAPPPPPLNVDDDDDIDNFHDQTGTGQGFSHSSFLWNF